MDQKKKLAHELTAGSGMESPKVVKLAPVIHRRFKIRAAFQASEHTGGARGVDTEVDTDSFVVSDDYLTGEISILLVERFPLWSVPDDNTSLTTSDGELSRGDGTSHFRAARRQPLRAAKVAIFAVFAALQLSLRKQPFQTEFDEKVPDRHSVLDGSSSDDSIGEYDA